MIRIPAINGDQGGEGAIAFRHRRRLWPLLRYGFDRDSWKDEQISGGRCHVRLIKRTCREDISKFFLGLSFM